ncbi:Photosynthetic NDH subunit of subcomplex B [Parasponia andersonii]|uniref:Photosynthetic NDH subunit of subcomplex B n=1 Tax=Parasponia andersonii TaxID=3476 RepID=A0A2P5AUC8_PARAD|nr:Photosynthetic NDH subunit of subcomplex B [Parasponia andersonii]
MAVQSCSLPLLSSPSLSKLSPNYPSEASIKVSIPSRRFTGLGKRISSSSWRLNAAGLSEIEPDLNEDPVDRWATNSVSPEDFVYGVYDGHHTYNEGEDKGTFWGTLAEEFVSVDPPTGFQGLISWLFPPAVAAGMYFNVPGEYLFIGAGLFTVVFCIIEMDKPDQPHNFEPQIYNMERGARDKLISDYNTMDIWDFNEKYGDLWDFTIKKDNITKRDR